MNETDRMVTIDDVRAAAERLRGIALAALLVPFTTPDGRPILLKAESLQPIGAFKIRGAFNAIARLDPSERSGGVVASSSGNHGGGVARAPPRGRGNRVHAGRCTAVKLERVRADGAEVITVDPLGPVTNQEPRAHTRKRTASRSSTRTTTTM